MIHRICALMQRKEISSESNLSEEVDDKPETYLDITKKEGHIEVVDILKDHQEVGLQELDEESFGDELEIARKGIIEYLIYRYSYVFLLRGKDRGKHAWSYVLIDPGKKEMFLEQCKTDSVDSANYGRVLYSGWGENPPQDIEDEIAGFIKIFDDLFQIKCENKSAYYYVLVNPDKKEMFQEQSKKGSAFVGKIKDNGEVLYSGLGQDPPESISDRISIGLAHFCTDNRSLEKELDNLSVNDDALHEAVRNGELEKVRYLIRKGANVNSADKNGWTSLHHAAYVGNLEVVKCLIDSRADLHVNDTVCERKAIHIAAREGNTGIVKHFLSMGVGANNADKNSWTPLHYAVWNGHLETAKLLINERADIYAKDVICGKKPIHVAAERGYTNVVELFLRNGTSVDDTDDEGNTSLYYAVWRGHFEVMKILADRDAYIHAGNIHGTKPIHIAAMEGHKNIIEFLLDRGASVNDSGSDNYTPLHYAAQNGQLEVARYLMKKGANIDARDGYGKTPLDLAREEGHKEIVGILE